jgi:diguanylate cyclase (GGDEF)-like protein
MRPPDPPPGLEKPRRILLIEDTELYRLWLRRHLSGGQFEVAEAPDGLAGIEICRNDPPDLVLLDLALPGCDGFEVLRRLKGDQRTSAIPVIVVSSASETHDKARGLDLGAVDYVTKPFDPVELQARVRVALRTKRLLDLLEQRAHVDGLTGLSNRAALEERLTAEWARFQRHGGALAVLIVDLDHFKAVNDTYGHAAGDEVLRVAAETLRAAVRTSDLAARYGGEEFLVIAPQCDLAGAVKTADRFRHRLSATPIPVDKGPLRVTASVGAAAVPEIEAGSPVGLLARADHALYQAKARGRDRVVCDGGRSLGGSGNGRMRQVRADAPSGCTPDGASART